MIGRAVAERLGVPFVDRAIPAKVASDLGVTLEDALARDERVKGWLHRLLTAAAPISSDYLVGPTPPRVALLPDTEYVTCTRHAIHETVREHGGVIVGRAAAIVLRDHPTALHVRLDGDPERRIRQAMRTLHIDEHEARNSQIQNDNARTSYVRHFYRVDPTDPAHYHLLLDSTRLSFDTCAELIIRAAREERPLVG